MSNYDSFDKKAFVQAIDEIQKNIKEPVILQYPVYTDNVINTWPMRSTINNAWHSVCWSAENKLLVAVGSNKVMYSYDGLEWILTYTCLSTYSTYVGKWVGT